MPDHRVDLELHEVEILVFPLVRHAPAPPFDDVVRGELVQKTDEGRAPLNPLCVEGERDHFQSVFGRIDREFLTDIRRPQMTS